MTHDEQRDIYLQYMQMKIQQRDWHGVADCAMDLRELEVECARDRQEVKIVIRNPHPP